MTQRVISIIGRQYGSHQILDVVKMVVRLAECFSSAETPILQEEISDNRFA